MKVNVKFNIGSQDRHFAAGECTLAAGEQDVPNALAEKLISLGYAEPVNVKGVAKPAEVKGVKE